MCGLASADGVGPPCATVRSLRAHVCAAVILLACPPALAFPIRVSTATELVLEPEIAANRQALSLAVHLRDDQRVGVGRGLVSVSVNADGIVRGVTVTTDARGEATLSVPLEQQTLVVDVDATFAGNDRLAPATAHAHVPLDAPFVTVELLAPSAPVQLGTDPEFRLRVDTGRVVGLDARGLSVAVAVREGLRVVASGLCDASGQATLVAQPGAFPRAGEYTLLPRVQVPSRSVVEGRGVRVLVRVGTTLAAAVVSEPDAIRARIRGQIRTARGEPVPHAPLRLVRGEETIAAMRADDAGDFVFEVDLDAGALQGSTMRVRFDPADPSLTASESSAMVVGEAPSTPIHWAWTVVPWFALALAGLAMALRRRSVPEAAVVAPPEAPEGVVVRTGAAPDGGVDLTIEPFDRSTGLSLGAAVWRLADVAGASAHPSSDSVPIVKGRAAVVEVTHAGYEPRRVELGRLPSGRHRVRVGLLGWREALFDRARPALAAARADGAVMPTPREAAGATRAAGAAWIGLLEGGAYGPEAPDEGVVRAVEHALVAEKLGER